MSAATWSYREANNAHAIIRGVCARIAQTAGVPVWMPRAAFVIFGLMHWLLALIAYFVMSRLMCLGRKYAAQPQPLSPTQSAVRDRFSALDSRLADMEAATLQQEASLRRAFRDLENK